MLERWVGDNIEMYLKNRSGRTWIGFIWFRIRASGGMSHGIAPLGFVLILIY
jgi:hypothetical protein